MTDDIENSTHSMLKSLSPMNNQYGGMYRGTVLNNNDPLERGRCKVFIRGVYSDEFEDNAGRLLPWAEPSQPLFCGGMGDDGKNGTFQCPDVGSTVWCFFESGDTSRPIMFGQTTDSNGKFSINHCTFKWEKMKIDLCRDIKEGTNVISIYADTDINEDAKVNNINRTAGNIINDTASVTINIEAKSSDVNIKAGNNVNVDAATDINIKSGSKININAGSELNENSPTINIKGGSGDCIINGISLVNHVHVGNLGAPTSPPI